MEALLGLIMLYAWGHTIYLNYSKLENLTQYEKIVVVIGWIGFVLYLIGTLS